MTRSTPATVDKVVAILDARLDELANGTPQRARMVELQTKPVRTDDERQELVHLWQIVGREAEEARELAVVLADIEAKQEHATSVRTGQIIDMLVGKKRLDQLPDHQRAKMIRLLTGEDVPELAPMRKAPAPEE